jgi:hypothetical protein
MPDAPETAVITPAPVSETISETAAAETVTSALTEPSSETSESSETSVESEETDSETASETNAWNETSIIKTMYVTQPCYSRARAIVGSDAVSQYSKGTQVNVEAITDTGYYKLEDGSFIHSDYLSDEPVAAPPVASAVPAPPVTTAATRAPAATTGVTAPPSGSVMAPVTSSLYNKNYRDKYGYKQLNSLEQELYANIVEAAESLAPHAEVPAGLYTDDIIKVYGMVFNQEPQLFWLSPTVPSGITTLSVNYALTDVNEINAAQSDIDRNVSSIMSKANAYTSSVSKLKVLFDWVVSNNDFLLEGSFETCSIYNGLRTGTAQKGVQCVGYAKSLQYLLDVAGFDAMVITGMNESGSSHAWNVVYCDNGWYNLDSGWAEPTTNTDPDYIRYSYFLVPDEWIHNISHLDVNIKYKNDGSPIKYFNPPACTKTSCNYFKAYGKEYSTVESAYNAMCAEIDAVAAANKKLAQIRVSDRSAYQTLITDSYFIKLREYAKTKGASLQLRRTNVLSGVMVLICDLTY